MIITYHGTQHIKLALGDLTISYNPVSKTAKTKVTKYGANIALSSMNLPEYNGIEEVTHGNKEPFSIVGPGEYEVQGIFIKGVGVEAETPKGTRINTIYAFILDNMKVCFLGNLSKKLTIHEREEIDGADIVFACSPFDESGLNPFEIYTTAQSLNPKIIIPLGFSEKTLPLFLKEGGKDSKEYLEKLTVKRKDIDMKNGEVVTLMEV
jgi:L-ascorbate metabolism protein UlaG (beta-lactamase superfamily)